MWDPHTKMLMGARRVRDQSQLTLLALAFLLVNNIKCATEVEVAGGDLAVNPHCFSQCNAYP